MCRFWGYGGRERYGGGCRMSEYYVYWRGRLLEVGVGAEGRLERVIDELCAYPKIIAPVYELDVDRGTVGFGFAVEGFDSPVITCEWAEKALRRSLQHARVGAPGAALDAALGLRLCLDDRPTMRSMESHPSEATSSEDQDHRWAAR